MSQIKINMDRVAELLTERGIPSFLEQTGGGCATIFVGSYGSGVAMPGDEKYAVSRVMLPVGPGAWRRGEAHASFYTDSDVSFGLDNDDDSDDVMLTSENCGSEDMLADLLFAFCKDEFPDNDAFRDTDTR